MAWQQWINFIVGAILFIIGISKALVLVWLGGAIVAILSLWGLFGGKKTTAS